MKEELTLSQIIDWIMKNLDNRNAMDKISHIVFPYTSKYERNFGKDNGR